MVTVVAILALIGWALVGILAILNFRIIRAWRDSSRKWQKLCKELSARYETDTAAMIRAQVASMKAPNNPILAAQDKELHDRWVSLYSRKDVGEIDGGVAG